MVDDHALLHEGIAALLAGLDAITAIRAEFPDRPRLQRY